MENTKCKIVAAVLIAVLWVGNAHAQADLRYATDMWDKTVTLLGFPSNVAGTWSAFDSTVDVRPAVNAGIRKVALDVGLVAWDTVVIADGVFNYSLNNDFLANGSTRIPFQCYRLSAVDRTIQGLKQVESKDFGTTQTGTTVGSPATAAVGYSIAGNRFWLYPAGDKNDTIFIFGPADGWVTTLFSDSTNLDYGDREAACIYGAHLLARARGSYDLADRLLQDYKDWIYARTGRREGEVAQ